MSETIAKLATALAKAQSEIKGAKKDADNPFFKSTYADLASVWEACRKALSSNELAVTQTTEIHEGGSIVLRTTLMHSSGESVSGVLPVLVGDKATSQQLGSAITYNRRYALAAMVGVAPEEDDGNAASETAGKSKFQPKTGAVAASPLKQRMDGFSEHLDRMQTELQVTNLVASNNKLMAELKEKLPQDFEKLSTKINQTIEAFRLAEPIAAE